MSDLIERQAAIDALDFEIVHMTAYCDGKNEGNPLAQYNKGLEDGKKAIEALPPAQPEAPCYLGSSCEYQNPNAEIQEKRTETHAETHACDLISRSAVYDRVSRIVSVNHLDPEKVWFTPIGVKALIKEMPSAQPERKKGKWIYNSPVTMKCDQCGLVIKDWDWHRFKFCPNCDCDMRGEPE